MYKRQDYSKDIDYQNHIIRVYFREDNENGARAKNAEYLSLIHILKRLRKKLHVVEDGAGNCIVSVRDIGYKFELNNENEQQ